MAKKKIGIIGSGLVAQALGTGFLNYGYPVMLGTRDASKLNEWQMKENNQAKIGSVEDTVSFGEIIILAVKGSAAKSIVEGLAQQLAGKTIIDTTNPIAPESAENGVLRYFTTINYSLMEELQKTAPAANFVKAFSSIGNHLMVNPTFSTGKPTMFICGNNDHAKKETGEILTLFGWEIADMGKVEAARAIEPLCMLWCIPGFLNNEWSIAFKLLRS